MIPDGPDPTWKKKKNNADSPMHFFTERFEGAVSALVREGPIKQRLARAYSENLLDLEHQELPSGLDRLFVELSEAMRRVEPIGSETRVQASIKKMSTADADRHALTIVKLYSGLLHGAETPESPKVVKIDPPAAPKYLVRGS